TPGAVFASASTNVRFLDFHQAARRDRAIQGTPVEPQLTDSQAGVANENARRHIRPSAYRRRALLSFRSPGGGADLNTEIALQETVVRPYVARRAFMDDVPVVDDVDALGEFQSRGQVLLDQHDGLAAGGEIAADLHQVADDDRREPFEGFVEQ